MNIQHIKECSDHVTAKQTTQISMAIVLLAHLDWQGIVQTHIIKTHYVYTEINSLALAKWHKYWKFGKTAKSKIHRAALLKLRKTLFNLKTTE